LGDIEEAIKIKADNADFYSLRGQIKIKRNDYP